MTIQAGEPLWNLRKTRGAPRKYETPEEVGEVLADYFQWVQASPLQEEKVFCNGGEIIVHQINKLRSATLEGACLALGVTRETWYEWKRSRADLSDILAWGEECIRDWNIVGAQAGLLNPTITARYHGLTEKTESKNDTTINVGDASTSELYGMLQQLLDKEK